MLKFVRTFNCKCSSFGATFKGGYSKMLRTADNNRPIEYSISSKINDKLKPEHLEIINESYMHNVPKGSETHFKVIVVSNNFENVPLINRHRMINELLRDELNSGVHALSIVAKTPSQWSSSDKNVSPSPACRGGFGK